MTDTEIIRKDCNLTDLFKKLYLRIISKDFPNERIVIERESENQNFSLSGLFSYAKEYFLLVSNNESINKINSINNLNDKIIENSEQLDKINEINKKDKFKKNF